MNRVFLLLLANVALVASMAPAPVFGQADGLPRASVKTLQARYDVRASDLIGKEVRNNTGDLLGRIEDLFLDTHAQRVRYAVLSSNLFPDIRNKLFAFPLHLTYRSPYGGEVVINVEREILTRAPGFTRGMEPELDKRRLFQELAQFFGEDAPLPKSNFVLASTLIGRDVKGPAEDASAELEDFVLDMASGRIAFAALNFDDMASDLVLVPFTALSIPENQQAALQLNMERQRLDPGRAFRRNNWPELNSRAFQENINRYFLILRGPAPEDSANEAQSGRSGKN